MPHIEYAISAGPGTLLAHEAVAVDNVVTGLRDLTNWAELRPGQTIIAAFVDPELPAARLDLE